MKSRFLQAGAIELASEIYRTFISVTYNCACLRQSRRPNGGLTARAASPAAATEFRNEPRGREMIEVNGSHSQIRSFILEKFPTARKRALSDDLPLLESGVIDSLGVLDVVGFLERTFEIKIEDEELIPDNFGTMKSMVCFVETKIGLRQGVRAG